MDKLSFVKNGVLRLPPGFRFHPTDEELVVQYLKRKVLSCPLPASIIPDVDVCKSDPWDLPGDSEKERYFFSNREVKYPNGNRRNRATGSGYWKATGIDKQIVTSRGGNHHVVGMKKTLVFYRGKPPHGARTDWIMHEYRLHEKNSISMENWVLCRIFLKKRNSGASTKQEDVSETEKLKEEGNGGGLVFYDFMAKNRGDLNESSSSSGSSGVTTEVSCPRGAGDHEEEEEEEESSSCNNSFSSFRRKI